MNKVTDKQLGYWLIQRTILLFAVFFLPATVYAKPESSVRVSINLSGVSLNSLVTYLSKVESKPVLLDVNFPKNEIVSVVSSQNSSLTNQELFKIVKGILQSRGWAIVQDESYLQIIPLKEALTMAQLVKGKPVAGASQFITKIIALKYAKAQMVAQALQRHKSPEGMLTPSGSANQLLITDYAPTVERIEEIVSQIDVAPLRPETKYLKLKNIRVENLVPIVSDYISSLTGSSATAKDSSKDMSANTIKITTDVRSNSLVIIGMPQEVQKVMELIAQVDTPVNSENNIHIYKVKYGDPRYLWSVLTGAQFSDDEKLGSVSGMGDTSNTSTKSINRTSMIKSTDAKELAIPLTNVQDNGGKTRYVSAKMKVVADVERSCLLIFGPAEEYRQIVKILDELDQPKKQVHLETAIVEMTDEKSRALGVEYGYLDSPGSGNLGPFATLSNNLSKIAGDTTTGKYTQVPTLAGDGLLSVGVFWEDVFSIPMLIQMSEKDSDIDILARPTLTTDNHKQAMIDISEENATKESNTTSDGTISNGLGEPIVVGTTLTLTPHVNDENLIRLQVLQTISEFSNTAISTEISDLGGRNIYRRSADTELTVPNGKMAVIGGLIKEKVEESEMGVPGLKKIPVIGPLFRSRSISKTKTNLCIFITPNVIDNTERFTAKSKKRYESMRKCMKDNDLQLLGDRPEKSSKCKSLGEKNVMDEDECECEDLPVMEIPCPEVVPQKHQTLGSIPAEDLRPMTEAEFRKRFGEQKQNITLAKPEPVEEVVQPVGPQRKITNLSELKPGQTYSAAELSNLSFSGRSRDGAIVIEQ